MVLLFVVWLTVIALHTLLMLSILRPLVFSFFLMLYLTLITFDGKI